MILFPLVWQFSPFLGQLEHPEPSDVEKPELPQPVAFADHGQLGDQAFFALVVQPCYFSFFWQQRMSFQYFFFWEACLNG
jgi:hypothetical protein